MHANINYDINTLSIKMGERRELHDNELHVFYVSTRVGDFLFTKIRRLSNFKTYGTRRFKVTFTSSLQ